MKKRKTEITKVKVKILKSLGFTNKEIAEMMNLPNGTVRRTNNDTF